MAVCLLNSDGHTSTAAHSKAVILRVTSVWNQLWSWECWENNQNVCVLKSWLQMVKAANRGSQPLSRTRLSQRGIVHCLLSTVVSETSRGHFEGHL